jgi:hypothetical protein
VPGYDTAGTQNLSCPAGSENIAGFPDTGIVSVLIAKAQPGIGIFDCILQAVKLLQGDDGGFFHKDMDTLCQSIFRHGHMQVMGRTDVEDIRFFPVKHILQGGVGICMPDFGICLCFLCINVCSPHKSGVYPVCQDPAVKLRNASTACNCGFHIAFSFPDFIRLVLVNIYWCSSEAPQTWYPDITKTL